MRRSSIDVVSMAAALLLTTACVRINNRPLGDPKYVDPPSQPLPGWGIDSKEMRAAADRMARSIMNEPKVVRQEGTPRIVLDEKYFRNESTQIIDKGLFTDYLRVALQQAASGHFDVLGRNYDDMVESERQSEDAGDVTSGAVVESSKRLGWDYRLGGAIRSISKVVPGSGGRSSYFLITFELVERGSGLVVWSDRYEFKKVANTSVIYR